MLPPTCPLLPSPVSKRVGSKGVAPPAPSSSEGDPFGWRPWSWLRSCGPLCLVLLLAGCQPPISSAGLDRSAPARTTGPAVGPLSTARPAVAPSKKGTSAADAPLVVRPVSLLPRAPHAEKIAHDLTVFGQQVKDDYFWLQNREDQKVLDYLDAENRYADAALQHTEGMQRKLYAEFLARTKQKDQTVPEKLGPYYYYSRWDLEQERQYNVHCRRRGSMEAPEEILLDENELAVKDEYFSLGPFELSPDQNWLVFGVDSTGSEEYTLHVKNLQTGQVLGESIENCGEAVAWANDNRTFFYVMRDDASRPNRLYRHVVGTKPDKDDLVYEEPDKAFFLSIARTRSDRYLLLELASNTTSEIRFLDASRPKDAFQVIQSRVPGVMYDVRHQGDTFWIVTNDQASNSRLVAAPVSHPDRTHWKEVIPNRADVKLESVEAFAGHLVLLERWGGLPRLRIRDLKSGAMYEVAFHEPVYSVTLDTNPEYDTHTVRFIFSSPITPDSVVDYDVQSREKKLLKRDEVVGGYKAEDYRCEQVWATASDGTRVPISLVYKRGIKRDGRNPVLLYAYGAYGLSEDLDFDSARLSLLDRGFIYAVAHVRGGGELGHNWYEQGKLKFKPNTFTDFISCAEYLIQQKYTSPQRLAISGASAGGLLIGAVVNMRPDLFQAVIADVPFVDVLHTMLNPKLPLTVTEYEEWGNPQQKEYFDLIRSYSPYDNVRAQAYPNMLVRGAFNDAHVSYWEPVKWVARLRATKTDDHVLLLKVDLDAGHNGVSGRYDYLDSQATEYAFLLDCLGISE